jgi:S1-C subfamily serine protease
MRTLWFRNLILLLIAGNLGLASSAWAKNLEDQVLRVYSYVQRPDYDSPWSARATERLVHMGVVVDAEHILVAAYAVTWAQHYEVEKIGDNRRYPLELVFVDPSVNLALLRFDKDRPDGLKALPIGGDMAVGQSINLYQGLEGESLVSNSLRIREVEVRSVFLTGYLLPQYVLEQRRTGYGWFEPLIQNQKLVGAAIAQSGSSVYALPARLIQRFLDDVRKAPYEGFVSLGMSLVPLLSPDLRSWAKAEQTRDGVWIHSIQDTSPFAGKVKDGDILLEFDGIPVSARGSYQHPKWGRISVMERLSEKRPGQKLQLKLLRRGETLTVEAELQRVDPGKQRIPSAIGEDPIYMIFGGLILQELSQGLLESWGPQWRKRAPLPYTFHEAYHAEATQGGRGRYVVLQRVLPLEFNKGYHELEDFFVSTINGQPVHNIEDAAKAFNQEEAIKSGFARILLQPGDFEIILSYAGLDQTDVALQQRYAVPATARFWKRTGSP